MKRRFLSSILIQGCALLAINPEAWACGSGPIVIADLFSGNQFQVAGLNNAGQVTGYFYDAGSPAHAFLYQAGSLTDLGTLGGSISEGFGINSQGQIVGASFVAGDAQFHGFVYTGGNLLDLGTLGGSYSSASLINDAGQIAGDSLLPDAAATTGFFYDHGAMLSLGTLGGDYSSPLALSGAGQIAGESSLTNGDLHAFRFSNAAMLDLGTLGGNYSAAFSLNNSGAVVGESAVSSGDVHGFVYSGGTMTDLGTFGGTYSSAFQINTNGQVIGVATTPGDAETHGFISAGNGLVDLGTLGGTSVAPYAINNCGQVVGSVTGADGSSRAFLWQTNQMLDLNSLLPADSGWQLSIAQFINDAGRIVGLGVFNGASEWFILDLPSSSHPPIAAAGPDQTVDCQSLVTLDGRGSSDPDGGALAYEWSAGATQLGTTAVLTVSLPLGTNVVTLKVTNPCGVCAQTNVTVIVADTTPPTGTCPAPVTASADSTCQAPIPSFTSQVEASDNCTPTQGLTINQSPVAGTLVGLGPHPVTVTVTDGSGNSSSCSVLFTVADTTPPAILEVPKAITVSAGTGCQALVPDVLAGVVARDSCTPADQLIKNQSPAAGTLIGLGSHPILVTVADAAGNSSTATVGLTVADTTPPTILYVPGPITAAADGHCQAVVPNVLGQVVAEDNCTPVAQLVLSQTPAAGTTLPDGDYTIVVTVADASGNSSTQSIPFLVRDLTAPVFNSLTVSPDVLSPPNHQLVPVAVSAAVSDNCDTAPLTQIVSITCNDATAPGDIQITGNLTATLAASKSASGGTRVYTLTVSTTDHSGNSTVGQVTVTVPKSPGTGPSGGSSRKH